MAAIVKQVLICDDDGTTRLLLKHLLKRSGQCQVTEVEGGMDALDLLAQAHFDLLVVNMKMPEITGLEMLRIIRETPEIAGQPVVVIGADAEEQQVREAMALGVRDFLVKPLDTHCALPRLLRTITRLSTVTAA